MPEVVILRFFFCSSRFKRVFGGPGFCRVTELFACSCALVPFTITNEVRVYGWCDEWAHHYSFDPRGLLKGG